MPQLTARHLPPVWRRVLSLAGAAAALAGCGQDPLEAASAGNVDTVPVAFVVYPFSTAAASLNTAISISNFRELRPALLTATAGGGLSLVPNFDFAVDRAADGRIRFVPSKLITDLTGAGRVLRNGLRVVSTPFDSLDAAPDGGYQRDSATVVSVGQTLAVETEPPACPNGRTFLYAKLAVDSVSATTGAIYIRGRIDPNCGYRSLRPGRPTS
jgi:hypothetical protein